MIETVNLQPGALWKLQPGTLSCVTHIEQQWAPNGGATLFVHRTPLWRVLLRALFQPSSWDERFCWSRRGRSA